MNYESTNVEVMKVSNGVIVRPNSRSDACVSDSALVFDSRDAFVKWAGEFFPKDRKERA